MRIYSRFFIAATVILCGFLGGGTFLIAQETTKAESGQNKPVEIVIGALRGPTGVGVAPIVAEAPVVGTHASLTVEVVPEPSIMVGRLASGEIDMGMLPSNVAAQLYNRGIPIQIGAVTLWGLLYIVSSDEGITGWNDLSGRTVHAINRGAGPDIMLRHILRAHDIEPEKDVALDYRFGHVELAQMVIAGEVETAVLPEPFVTQVLTRRSDVSIRLDFQTAWEELHGTDYPQTVVLVRRELAENHPDAVSEALAAIRSGWETVVDDPEGGGELAVQANLGLPADIIQRALPRFNVRYLSAVDARDQLDRYFQILYEGEPRSVGGAVPDQGIYLPFE